LLVAMFDADGLGPIDYSASGTPEDRTGLKIVRAVRTVGQALGLQTLVPPWGIDTWDGYDIYAGNWPVTDDVPACPIGSHKSGEGLGTYDVRFPDWVRSIAPRHRYRLAYHVIWPWRDGKPPDYIERQAADYLMNTTRAGFKWDEPGWGGQIDNEMFSGMHRSANNDEVARFDAYVTARVGPRLFHYCNPVTDTGLYYDDTLCGGRKWEAQYNRNPSRPLTWIRQWGGIVVPGMWNGRPVDANYITPEKRDEMEATLGYTTPPNPPPEDDMPKLTLFRCIDADAVFIGYADRGYSHQVEWCSAERMQAYQTIAGGMDIQTTSVPSFRWITLVGGLPVGDSRHAWVESDFWQVVRKGDAGLPGASGLPGPPGIPGPKGDAAVLAPGMKLTVS
jgi:hypothetical protein